MPANELIVIKNPDKGFHEKWTPKRNMLNIPHPFRAVLLGPPGVGKTMIVKNLIMRADPPFKRVYVIHCDPGGTLEYGDLGPCCHMLEEIPNPEDWKNDCKQLVVLDDKELKTLKNDQKRNLDRLFGFVSTHKNISVVCCSQDAFNVPPIVRRCSSLFVLWKGPDLDAMAAVSRKTGMPHDKFKRLMQTCMTEPRDSLWIDITPDSPYRLRKNGFTLLQRKP